jgi:glutamine amidotransferase
MTQTSTVAVIDYGMGNLRSVSQAVQHAAKDLNLNVVVTNDPDVVHAAERVVLPGQGPMAAACWAPCWMQQPTNP